MEYTLKRKGSNLCNRTHYISKIETVINSIYEYDISKANLSMIKEYNILPSKEIKKIEKMDNMERKVYIGLLKRDNKKLVKIEKDGILKSKRILFDMNNIKDEEILAIRNDAVFIIGRKLKYTNISDNIEFVLKNQYTSMHTINNIQFLYNKRNNTLDMKGINIKNDTITNFLSIVFKYIEMDRLDELRKYLIDMSIRYRERKLPYDFYREFNHENIFRYNTSSDYSILLDNISEKYLPDINIVYNYITIFIPLIRKYG